MNRSDDQVRLTFHLAREEANVLGHAQVGPDHLLLGLLRVEGGGGKPGLRGERASARSGFTDG